MAGDSPILPPLLQYAVPARQVRRGDIERLEADLATANAQPVRSTDDRRRVMKQVPAGWLQAAEAKGMSHSEHRRRWWWWGT